MKTYWDLSEKERAALTEEDVERFIDAELMTKGVLRAPPLQLLPEPTLPEPDTAVVILRQRYERLDLAFPTAEAAEQAMRGGFRLMSAYLGSTAYSIVEPLESELIAERVHSKAQVDTFKREFEKVGEIRRENERRSREHQEQNKKECEVLKGLWSDWHECRATAVRMARVLETFDEYVRIAGDENVARRFLAKVFDVETITSASEWHARDLLCRDLDFAEVADELPEPAPLHEGAAF